MRWKTAPDLSSPRRGASCRQNGATLWIAYGIISSDWVIVRNPVDCDVQGIGQFMAFEIARAP
jgi:hypothetical protein